MKLKSKVAIITGAGAGIGRSTSLLFAKEGAHVAAVDVPSEGIHSLAQEITSAGGSAEAIVTDVSKADDVENVFRVFLMYSGESTFCLTTPALCRRENSMKPPKQSGTAAWR